jgi:glutathione S-transferase
MDIALRVSVDVAESTHKDVRRIIALWSELLGRFGGPFLLGPWSVADAFFTPVATRFRSYGISLADLGDQGAAAAYGERLLATPEFLEWESGALAEKPT